VACPFFMPIEKLENGAWPHAARLPLGCGWSGHCAAPGHEGEIPSQQELGEFCNLGYAANCARLPEDRLWDSVRFDARTVCVEANSSAISHIQVRYVCERAHYPGEHGTLEFDSVRERWEKRHGDDRIQRMAECFVASYLDKKKSREVSYETAS